MSEMVERVAHAVCCPEGCLYGTAEHRGCGWRSELRAARAAIAALREPTEAMIEAAWYPGGESGDTGLYRHQAQDAWRAMIDEALK